MPLVTLLRHAQSEYQAGNREVFDANITELGKRQAAGIVGHYDLVICSTLSRTKQTLQYSQITYDKVIYLELAREKRSMNCDFLPNEEVVLETNAEFMQRMLKLKETLLDLFKSHQKILYICHGGVIKALTATNVDDVLKNGTRPNGTFVENCLSLELDLS